MFVSGTYVPAADLKFLGIINFSEKFRSFGQFLLDTFIGIWMTDGNTYIPQAWTLSYEMMGSILLYVVLFGFHGLKQQCRVLFTAALCMAFAVASTFYGNMLIYYHDFLVGLLIAMFIVWKGENDERFEKFNSINYRFIGFFLFLLGLFLGSYPLYILGNNSGYWKGMKAISDDTQLFEKFWYTIGSSALIFGIVLCDWLQRFFSFRLFSFIGKISYPLYLIHLQLMASAGAAIFKALRDRAHLSHDASACIMLLLYTIMLVPLSWLGVPLLDTPSITIGRWFENVVRQKAVKEHTLPVTRVEN